MHLCQFLLHVGSRELRARLRPQGRIGHAIRFIGLSFADTPDLRGRAGGGKRTQACIAALHVDGAVGRLKRATRKWPKTLLTICQVLISENRIRMDWPLTNPQI